MKEMYNISAFLCVRSSNEVLNSNSQYVSQVIADLQRPFCTCEI